MIIAAKTDIGKQRSENQDRYRVSEISENSAVAIVCDGMGGTNGGGIASEVAINAIYDRLFISYREDMEPKSIKNLLISSVSAANTIVYSKSREEPENAGMGTTCVAALIRGTDIHIASVGDSRAYLLSASGIRQITNDHTVVQLLKQRGIVDEEELRLRGMKNVITRAVGVEERVEADYFELTAEKGDSVLICTDGLTNYCPDELIYAKAYKTAPESAAAELIGYANGKGGKDNITVAIISL